ncbi:hypothetical protein ABEV74_11505 [Paenibacillus cisolokensis]|uniref:hypothetical protein n=1 Tax=Paenibacillus cisolokensis TaxID=1658519 RepID=UPI003D2AA075
MAKRSSFLVVPLLLCMFLVSSLPSSSFAESSKESEIGIQAVRYEDTDIISVWRVTQQGHIYSPVSVTTLVTINANGVGSNYVATYREVYSQTFANYWTIYPNAQFGPVELVLRGSSVPLPNRGTYIHDPDYRVVGLYNNTQQTYPGAAEAAPGRGVSGFFAGSGGYQIDNTAQVDFTW